MPGFGERVREWPGRRWYVAWHPAGDVAVLRAKDRAGLVEWRSRDWRMFPGPPLIVDVTTEMGRLFARFAFTPPSEGNSCFCLALTLDESGPGLVARTLDATALNEVAVCKGNVASTEGLQALRWLATWSLGDGRGLAYLRLLRSQLPDLCRNVTKHRRALTALESDLHSSAVYLNP